MITITITDEEIEKVKKFSEEVVSKGSYNRFDKDEETRKKRFFYGKLGDVIALCYLESKGIHPNTKGMFEIYPGATESEPKDFFSVGNKKLDVRTPY